MSWSSSTTSTVGIAPPVRGRDPIAASGASIEQNAVTSSGAAGTGQVDPALAAPVDEEAVDLQHVRTGELGAGTPASRAARCRTRWRSDGGCTRRTSTSRPPSRRASASTPVGELVEQGDVVAQLLGRTGEGRGDPRARARPRAPAAPARAPGPGCSRGRGCAGRPTVSRPSTWQAVTVSSRRTPSSGRAKTPKPGRIPCSDRPPEPRARPRRTVSAWSSSVWPSSTRAAPRCAATSSRTAYRASPGGRLGPRPEPASTWTRAVSVSSTPIAASCATTRSAWSAEPGCSPWSTVTPTTRSPSLWPSKTAAEASASESAPPLQATATTSPGSELGQQRARTGTPDRGDRRVERHSTRATQASGSSISALDGSVSRAGPDGVELLHADLVDDVRARRRRRRGTAPSWRRGRAGGAAACRGRRRPGGAG